jgi:hypothetical protein
MDEYKGPITRSKSKQLSILRSENSIPKVSPDMAVRDKQPRDEHHEERQGGGRYASRNQGIPRFGNRRRVRDSPLNIIGENDMHLKDGKIYAKRHLHLFLDVSEFHQVEYNDVMVRLFLQTLL